MLATFRDTRWQGARSGLKSAFRQSQNYCFMADDPPTNPAPANPPTPSNAPAAPPAARVVTTGTKTEREITLETDLEAERRTHAQTAKEKKERELRIAELEDELHKLREPPRPAPEKKTALEAFFED